MIKVKFSVFEKRNEICQIPQVVLRRQLNAAEQLFSILAQMFQFEPIILNILRIKKSEIVINLSFKSD